MEDLKKGIMLGIGYSVGTRVVNGVAKEVDKVLYKKSKRYRKMRTKQMAGF